MTATGSETKRSIQTTATRESASPPSTSPPSEAKRGSMFASLRVRNYRLFFTGQVISNIGTWMQRIAQDWLVFTLSGNNPIALGVAVALQFTPTLFLSLWAGVLADRVDKRRLLTWIQVAACSQAAILGVLDITGLVALWQVYVLCFTLGITASALRATP